MRYSTARSSLRGTQPASFDERQSGALGNAADNVPSTEHFLPLVLRRGERGVLTMRRLEFPCRPEGLLVWGSPWTEEMSQISDVRSDALAERNIVAADLLDREIESLYTWSECIDVLVNVVVNNRYLFGAQVPAGQLSFNLESQMWPVVASGSDLHLLVTNPGTDREFRFAMVLITPERSWSGRWPPNPYHWPGRPAILARRLTAARIAVAVPGSGD